MSALTPTPLPGSRLDEVTQPNVTIGLPADDGRRGLARSPAQWEAEALAMAEEADLRGGVAAGALRYAAGRMLEDGAGDLASAMDHLSLAMADPPTATFRPVLRALRLHAVLSGSFWTAIDLLDTEIAAAATVSARADLMIEKADILDQSLLAHERARESWEEVLTLVPGHPGALRGLESNALRAGDAALLRRVLERRLAAAAPDATRARLLCRLAVLAEADQTQAADALGIWSRAVDLAKDGGVAALARRGLRRAAARAGHDAELARAVALEAEATKGAERAGWLALGSCLAQYRTEVTRSKIGARAAAMIDAALTADPDDRTLLLTAAAQRIAAGEWTKARQALDHHAELTRDRDWGAALLGMSAHVAERHENDPQAASLRYRRLLEARPTDPVALAALERIASRRGDAATQVALVVAEVDRSADPGERAALAMRAAEVAETAGHDLARAAALAERALESVAGYAPAVLALERLYPALGRWGELVKVIEAATTAGASADLLPSLQLAGNPDARSASLRLERLGSLYEDRLSDPGRALTLYAEWVALDTGRVAALRALLRAAEKAGDALVAAEAALKLGTEIPELPVDVRFAWCCRAANIYEERAAADEEAVRAYEAALALQPGARPALAGLARAHERRGDVAALTRALAELAAAENNPANASAWEVEIARLQRLRLGRRDEALEASARALAYDASNVAAIGEHARLLWADGKGEPAAETLAALGEALADPADKAGVYRLQAEVLEWQLGRPREALTAIERATSAAASAIAGSASLEAPAAIDRARATSPALEIAEERLYQLVGREAEVAARRLARIGVADLGQRLDLGWRLSHAEGRGRAVAAALELAPNDGAVLDVALALALGNGSDRDAALAFERLAGQASANPDEAAALWRAAASARARTATGPDDVPIEMLALLRRVVEARASEEALAILDRHATRAGDWPHAILARRGLAESASDGVARATLLWELGCAHLAAGDLGGADGDFARALEADPTFLPALRALARLREARGDARAAAELYAREGRTMKSPARAADGFRQAARLYAHHADDDAMAARCLEEVLALEPEAESDLEVLEALLRNRGDIDRLVQVMRRRAVAGPPSKRRDRLLALAELIAARDLTEAAAVLAEAVALDPTSVAALIRLAEVERELGRAAEAIATYRLAIAASSEPKVVSAAWVQIGDIAERALADGPQAVDAFRKALLPTPDDVAALTGLARGLIRQRDYPNAAITLRRLATVETEHEARIHHLITLGELLAGAAEDPEGAADAFEQALALRADHDLALDRLDTLLTRLEQPQRLAAALAKYLDVAPRAHLRRRRLAALFRGPLGTPDRAIEQLRMVVAEARHDGAARAELARVLEETGRLAEAMTEHLALLRLEPLRADSVLALRRLAERNREPRRALRAAAAMVALGLASAEDARLVAEARMRWTPEPTATLTSADFDASVRHPDERHPATALLAAMSEVLPRLYGLAVEDWGVTKQDRLRSDDPLRALILKVAGLFGVEEAFEIFVARTVATQVEIEAGPPPALLVPANLLALPRQEGYRQLGRQLGHLRAGTYSIARIPGKDLGFLVAAGVRTVYPEYGRGFLPDEQVNDVAQRIARTLPRRFRRAFEQAALSFRDAGVFDGERWRLGLLHTGHRAALVASGDVLGTFEYITRTDRRLAAAMVSPEERLAAARTNPEVVEMINFALSDELAALNRRLGSE